MNLTKNNTDSFAASLIIQGPLISNGVTGAYRGSLRNVKQKDIKNYNCSEAIEKNLVAAKNLFKSIVLSVWEGEEKYLEKNKLIYDNVDEIIYNKEPVLKQKYKKRNSNSSFQNQPFTYNNMEKQWTTTLSGIKAAIQHGADACVKIRTDQTLPISDLYSSLRMAYSQDKILVPYFDKNKPWALPDFYFGGNALSMFKLMDSLLNQQIKCFSQNVHDQFFFGGSFYLSKQSDINWIHYIKNTNYFSKHQKAIILNAWEKIWLPASEKIFKNLIWRGEKISINSYTPVFNLDESLEIIKKLPISASRNINIKLALTNLVDHSTTKKKFRFKIIEVLSYLILKIWTRF